MVASQLVVQQIPRGNHSSADAHAYAHSMAAMPSPSSQVVPTNPGGNSPISSKPAISFSRLIYPAPILSLLELAGQLVFTLLSTLWQNIHLLQSMVGLPTGNSSIAEFEDCIPQNSAIMLMCL